MAQTEKIINPQLIGQEYDRQRRRNNPFDLMRQTFNDYASGPVVLGLGAVGGGGAGEKARGILDQFAADRVDFRVIAMQSYLDANPSITESLITRNAPLLVVDDNTDIRRRYQRIKNKLKELRSAERTISGVLSLGPRTYYPYTAQNLGISTMIIDGAVPDKWDDDADPDGVPKTEYYLPAYLNGVYATTCGFSGWRPPESTYPEGMNLRVVAQPFSRQKDQYLRNLRTMSPNDCRWQLLKDESIRGLEFDDIIVIPTADAVYLDPDALTVFGRFLTPGQMGQTYGFAAELITSLSVLAPGFSGRNIALFMRSSIMRELLTPLIDKYRDRKIKVVEPTGKYIPNDKWLLLRKAGVTIGRAPLCVSTAEALGMGDYQITGAIPGRTSDGVSYMTEPEALDVLVRKGITRTFFPGDNLVDAINEVIKVKDLQNI